jgi:hypothetical protein
MKDSRIICKQLLMLTKEIHLNISLSFIILAAIMPLITNGSYASEVLGILKAYFVDEMKEQVWFISIIKFANGNFKFEGTDPLPSNVLGLNSKHNSINNEWVAIILMASEAFDFITLKFVW